MEKHHARMKNSKGTATGGAMRFESRRGAPKVGFGSVTPAARHRPREKQEKVVPAYTDSGLGPREGFTAKDDTF